MESEALRLATRLPVPAPGRSVRVANGSAELVIENKRGGFVLLWHAGRRAERHVLGLRRIDAGGEFVLEFAPPELPVRVMLQDPAVLLPLAWLHGYVQLPLVPTLWWRDGVTGSTSQLFAFPPRDLVAEWTEREGTTFCWPSPWLSRYPVPGASPRATVPLRLRNRTMAVCSTAEITLHLRADQLAERRRGIGAAPQRMDWNGEAWIQRPARAEVPA